MGYNTTVVVLNDALDQLEKDPDFGKKLAAGIRKAVFGKPVIVSVGNHANPVEVIETHHADMTSVVAVGGNCGNNLGTVLGWNHSKPEDQIEILKDLARQLGYNLRKIGKKRK